MDNQFLSQFSELIEVPPNEIHSNYNLKNNGAWDSLASICTIALVDKCFGVLLNTEDLQEVNYFSDLESVINQKIKSKQATGVEK